MHPAPPPAPLPALGPTASLRDFFVGFSLPWRSVGLIRRNPTLRRLSLAMGAVTALLLIALAAALFRWADDLFALLVPRPESSWLTAFWWLGVVAVGLLAFVLGALTLPPLALSPLQDPLGEATEALHGGSPAPFNLRELFESSWIGLKHTLVRLGLTFAGILVLLPLNLIPGMGSVAYGALATMWGMFALAAEHVGGPLARHRYPSRAVFRLARQRPALFLGLGAAVWMVLIIPVINAFFLPLAVIAGAEAFVSLERAGALPERTNPADRSSPARP